ncbi:MAG TPA: copper amine oxidase N-terminal domain-containing protein [Candidatus Rubrimentiphilum sp.]|nr:copper amine oxidase N-terminal domain-containing protein [Candidatus Rubrimentiphilum sp.]
MKRLSTGALTAMLIVGLGLTAVAAPSGNASQGNNGHQVIAQASPMPAPPPMNFGSPPSGQIPILFNDHHVYSRPDVLKQGRVLAALVRGGTILVPLRSMFEQMGATVSYDAGSKTVDVTKPGADVKVTVGVPQVVINGETRPLDVPPIMYQGQVLVPVRVISEGMGAYVQWVPDKRLVVVRYIPPTPPPPAVTATPSPAPVATPTPVPIVLPYQDHFIAGDYILSPKVYNEFSPGNTGSGSYAFRGAMEFNLFNLPWMIEGSLERWQYPHNTVSGFGPSCLGNLLGSSFGTQGCVTVIGGNGQTFVPAFTAQEWNGDGRLGLKVADPRIYIAVGYMSHTTNYGYPALNGIGFGLEKLPDLNQAFSLYGSVYYYPSISGTYTVQSGPQAGTAFNLSYRVLRYQVGATVGFGQSFPLFLDLGFIGDRGTNKTNAPSDYTHNGAYVGLGIHF